MGVDQRKPYQFKSTVWISIKPLRDDISIRYSSDGQMPDQNDQLYINEWSITDSKDLMIQAFNERGQLVGYTKRFPLEKL